MAKATRVRKKKSELEKLDKYYSDRESKQKDIAEVVAGVLSENSHVNTLLSSTPTEASLFASINAVLHKVRRTFKYKLYAAKRNKKLYYQINAAGLAHNHIIALHRRFYGLFKKHIKLSDMQAHLAKLKDKPRFAYMKEIGSQALQDVAERVEKGYQRFFDYIKDKKAGKHQRKVGLPKFRKVANYKSFTLKQAGWQLDENSSTLTINGQKYRYHNSRPVLGQIKTVTVKRDAMNDVYVFFSCVVEIPEVMARTGKSVGFDFGQKIFITASDGEKIESPLFFARNRNALKRADRRLSRKLEGSHNRKKSKRARTKIYRHIKDSRRDWFFKLAWDLCGRYALICIEDLSIEGMKCLNGRKVSDEAWGEFIKILEHVAKQCGSIIQKVGRFYPSTQICSKCGFRNKELAGIKNADIRDWVCPKCHTHHDRDYNAAVNILREGERLFKELHSKNS